MKENQDIPFGGSRAMRLPRADRGQGWSTLCYTLLLVATVISVTKLVCSVGGFCPVADRFYSRVRVNPTVLLGEERLGSGATMTNMAGMPVPAQPGPVVQPRVPEAEQRAASGTPRQKT